MTIRILNPLDWNLVKSGEWLQLNGDHDRIVKIEVNTDAPTRASLVHFDLDGQERTTFLGVVNGLEKIEVCASAEAALAFDTEGEVWFCTNDGVATAVHMPDERSFTQMVGRKTRNETLEQMIKLQQLSIERLVVAQEGERIARELAEERLAAATAPAAVVPPPVVGPSGGTEQPVPPASPPPTAAGETAIVAPAAPTVPA